MAVERSQPQKSLDDLRTEEARIARELEHLGSDAPQREGSGPGYLNSTTRMSLKGRLAEVRSEIASLEEQSGTASGSDQAIGGSESPSEHHLELSDAGSSAQSDPAYLRVDGQEIGTPPDRKAPDELVDPLFLVRGAGVKLRELLACRWPPPESNPDNLMYLSRGADHLLRIAATLADPTDGRRIVRPSHLLNAMIYINPTDGPPSVAEHANWLSSYSIAVYDLSGRASGWAFNTLKHPSEDAMTEAADVAVLAPESVTILLKASEIRMRPTEGYSPLHPRHLIVAFLLEQIGRAAIANLGLPGSSYRNSVDRLLEIVLYDPGFRSDYGANWQAIRSEVQESVSHDEHMRETHAFASDWTSHDLLGARQDAQALASLVLLKDLHPPLAIGIFGSWGSGKSTLMRMVCDTIKDGKDKGIYQVWFNAWSHADTDNLWASLTVELFEQLALRMNEETGKDELRNTLMEEIARRLAGDNEKRSDLAREIWEQLQVLERAKRDKESLVHDPLAVEPNLAAAAELFEGAAPKGSAGKDDEVKDGTRDAEAGANRRRLSEIFEAAGIDSVNKDDLREIAGFLEEASNLPSQVKLAWASLCHSPGRGIKWSAVLILLLATVGAVVWLTPQSTSWMASLREGISSNPILASVLAIIATVGMILWPAVPYLFMIARLTTHFLKKRDQRKAQLEKERVDVGKRIDEATQKLRELEKAQTEADRFRDAYALAAEGRSREGLLRYFISTSPELAEVRRKAGLLALVRKCFETLQQIMREKRDASAAESDIPLKGIPDIRRIIVYIDDLDRCSHDHVVQVLQALQLLLAFDLFVVIVAVDARWLHQAVGHVYKEQLAQPGSSPGGNDRATVADYLEKIFQIPLWIGPVSDPQTFRKFIDGIDRPDQGRNGDAATSPPDADQPEGEADPASSPGSTMIPLRNIPADPSFVTDMLARKASLTDAERDLLAEMAPLAGKSPRGAKRLVNTYRLMRAMATSEAMWDLEGGEGRVPLFPFVLLALACEVGLRPETVDLIAELAFAGCGRNLADAPLTSLLLAPMKPGADIEGTSIQSRIERALKAEGKRSAVSSALRSAIKAAGIERGAHTDDDANPPVQPERWQAFHIGNRICDGFTKASRFSFRANALG